MFEWKLNDFGKFLGFKTNFLIEISSSACERASCVISTKQSQCKGSSATPYLWTPKQKVK